MIAALVWYAAITSACVAVAALAAESLVRQLRGSVRWVWVVALALAVALPALVPVRQMFGPALVTGMPGAAVMLTPFTFGALPAVPDVSAISSDALRLGWILVSAALALWLAGVHVRYRRVRRRWPAAHVGGERVLVAPTDGPAVMGFHRPDIVVPRWLLTRSETEQRIVVAHEREHLRGNDPFMLAGGMFAALLMPWNPAVWFMFTRLRLAVELDCDARVVHAGTLPFAYGNLLIEVAALTARHRLPALALLNPPSQLQRRLIAMVPDRVRFPRVRGVALAAVAVISALAACEAAIPTDASVASLDATKARQAADLIGNRGDSVVYVVDGKRVSAADAERVKAEDILRTTLEAKGKLSGENVKSISIETKQAAEERAKVLAARMPREGAPDSASLKKVVVAANASDLVLSSGAMKAVREVGEFSGLVFVNGEQVPSSRLRELKASGIASVEVIKGAAAMRLYGEKARAGVIMITTK